MAETTTKATTKKTTAKSVAAEPKAAVEKKTATKAPAKAAEKKPATKRAGAKKDGGVNAEQRYNMIQEAAYYLAEQDSFNGDPMRYWALAEMQIEDMIASGRI